MQTYRFGEFELDTDAQQLRLCGKPVRLERRPLDLLVLLVSRPGSTVPRDDIIAALWPANVIIDFDSGLNTLVRKVRSALDDSSDQPRFIETVPGRGYRFIAPVSVAVPTETVPVKPTVLSASKKPRWRLSMTIVAILLVAGSAIFMWQSGVKEPGHLRIAVLPFENLTGNEELDYLASGIAEETSTSLAQVDLPKLSVIGVVSARALAGSGVPLPQIGGKLGVDFVVLSSLRLEKSRIRVTSRLIRVTDSEQVWSASFDRELTNVLGLQRELSIAIAEQIRQRLSPEVVAVVKRRQTENPEAYELYLKGRYEWTLFKPDSIPLALGYYQQAVIKDPGYALAWAGIAHALITSIVTAEADRNLITASAQDALQRALEFGPDLAETQLALGSFYGFLDRNLPLAEAAARKAIKLDPNNAMSYVFLGVVLSTRGKHLEARAMMRRARELDPLFPLTFANSSMVSLSAGEPQEALEFATQAIAINPEFWVGYLHLGNAQLALGNYDAALQAFTETDKFSGGNSALATSSRAFVLSKLGRTDKAREILAELASRSAEHFVSPYYFAVIQAGLGEPDAAFEWLDRELTMSNFSCFDLPNDPKLDSLRSDMRFESLLKRCGLSPELNNTY